MGGRLVWDEATASETVRLRVVGVVRVFAYLGLSACAPCEAGTYQSAHGSSGCLVCPQGHFCPEESAAR